MNLDDLEAAHRLDRQGMLAQIDVLPDQLEAAYLLGMKQPLPGGGKVRHVVLAGMGGSAIGADLLAAYAAPMARVPLLVWRNYDLPGFAAGEATLVIVSSHSGDTEEALSALEAGLRSRARLVAVTTGGELARRAEAHGVPVWRFVHDGQPRAAVGFSFGMLLAAAQRLGLVPDATAEVAEAARAMRGQQENLRLETPVARNLAKRMAGQLVERWPVILGSGFLAPVARRWRTQMSEIAKAVAQFEELPEADHNMVAGVEQPEALIGRCMVVLLRSPLEHPRNVLRVEATRQALMVEGFNTDVIEARGATRLAHQWTSLHFGDYTAFYLAMAGGVDPTPVAAIQGLKQRLAAGI